MVSGARIDNFAWNKVGRALARPKGERLDGASLLAQQDRKYLVPGARIELAHGYPYQILSLARLPVPPPRQRFA